MAEQELRVVLDPLVLSDALLRSDDCLEKEALQVLITNCSNKLIINDGLGRLGNAYLRDLKSRFPSMVAFRLRLEDTVVEVSKLVIVGQPEPTRSLQGLRQQHSRFLLAALAVKPRLVVYRVRQWDSQALRQQIHDDFDVRLLSVQEYINLQGQY